MAFDVIGRAGHAVREKWVGGARSYLGLMMHGFPNLFMVCGPNGPAALANIVTLDEQNVNWICGVIDHMRRTGLRTAEPTLEAEDAWMEKVFALAEQTLVSKANTWYTGTNVDGKPRGLIMYTGGFFRYNEACTAVADEGYPTLVFDRQLAEAG
jgi:hypothetical protein